MSLCWTLLGLVALIFGVFGSISEIRGHGALQRRGVTTDAVIIGVLARGRSDKATHVMIEFTTGQGVVREPLSVDRTSAAGLEAGHVLVTYDRANPATVKTAAAARSLDLWWEAWALATAVLGGCLGGLTFAAHIKRAKRRRDHDPDPRVAE